MTLSAGAGEGDDVGDTLEGRPGKRRKTQEANRVEADGDESTLVRRHPLGVRPSGNALTANVNAKDCCGSFARLPDELLILFLETLQVPHLLRLGSTCRALHAFTRSEEIWRTLFVEYVYSHSSRSQQRAEVTVGRLLPHSNGKARGAPPTSRSLDL
jgi:hypothetical protein